MDRSFPIDDLFLNRAGGGTGKLVGGGKYFKTTVLKEVVS